LWLGLGLVLGLGLGLRLREVNLWTSDYESAVSNFNFELCNKNYS